MSGKDRIEWLVDFTQQAVDSGISDHSKDSEWKNFLKAQGMKGGASFGKLVHNIASNVRDLRYTLDNHGLDQSIKLIADISKSRLVDRFDDEEGEDRYSNILDLMSCCGSWWI